MNNTEVTWRLAGPGGVLTHRASVGASVIDMELGLSTDDPAEVQMIQAPRGYLVSALTRSLRIHPVKGRRPVKRPFDLQRLTQALTYDQDLRDQVLEEAGARTVWDIATGEWRLIGTNGADGVAVGIDNQLWPITNTKLFHRLCTYFGSY